MDLKKRFLNSNFGKKAYHHNLASQASVKLRKRRGDASSVAKQPKKSKTRNRSNLTSNNSRFENNDSRVGLLGSEDLFSRGVALKYVQIKPKIQNSSRRISGKKVGSEVGEGARNALNRSRSFGKSSRSFRMKENRFQEAEINTYSFEDNELEAEIRRTTTDREDDYQERLRVANLILEQRGNILKKLRADYKRVVQSNIDLGVEVRELKKRLGDVADTDRSVEGMKSRSIACQTEPIENSSFTNSGMIFGLPKAKGSPREHHRRGLSGGFENLAKRFKEMTVRSRGASKDQKCEKRAGSRESRVRRRPSPSARSRKSGSLNTSSIMLKKLSESKVFKEDLENQKNELSESLDPYKDKKINRFNSKYPGDFKKAYSSFQQFIPKKLRNRSIGGPTNTQPLQIDPKTSREGAWGRQEPPKSTRAAVKHNMFAEPNRSKISQEAKSARCKQNTTLQNMLGGSSKTYRNLNSGSSSLLKDIFSPQHLLARMKSYEDLKQKTEASRHPPSSPGNFPSSRTSSNLNFLKSAQNFNFTKTGVKSTRNEDQVLETLPSQTEMSLNFNRTENTQNLTQRSKISFLQVPVIESDLKVLNHFKKKLKCVSNRTCLEKFQDLTREHEKYKKFLKALNKLVSDLSPSGELAGPKMPPQTPQSAKLGDKDIDIKRLWAWIKNLCTDYMSLKKDSKGSKKGRNRSRGRRMSSSRDKIDQKSREKDDRERLDMRQIRGQIDKNSCYSSKKMTAGARDEGWLKENLEKVLKIKNGGERRIMEEVSEREAQRLHLRTLEDKVRVFLHLDTACSVKDMIQAFDNLKLLAALHTQGGITDTKLEPPDTLGHNQHHQPQTSRFGYQPHRDSITRSSKEKQFK